MPELLDNATVIIRTAGERTQDLCYALATQQVPEDQVFRVQLAPMTVATRRAFEIGIEQNRTWTILIDGDLLLNQGSIRNLVAGYESPPKSLFTVMGVILDKFFGGVREGGIRVFRTRYLPKAIDILSQTKGQIRPDTTLVNLMTQRRYDQVKRLDIVTAIHDYEQFYRDIYRKAFVYARKHKKYIPYLIQMWKRLATHDFDYQVAVWGARAGLGFDQNYVIDIRTLPQEIAPLLALSGVKEKSELSDNAYTSDAIKNLIFQHQPASEYHQFEWMLHQPAPFKKLLRNMRRLQYWRLVPWLIGISMKESGSRLERWANGRST